jgi:hypothetical protein
METVGSGVFYVVRAEGIEGDPRKGPIFARVEAGSNTSTVTL